MQTNWFNCHKVLCDYLAEDDIKFFKKFNYQIHCQKDIFFASMYAECCLIVF